MVERKRVALIYSVNKGWIAGTYYILNLICALKTLSETDRPIVVLVCSCKEDFEYVKSLTKYPYLISYFSKQPFGIIKRIINKVSRWVIGENICDSRLEVIDAAFVFPVQRWNTINTCINKVFWIPDFQHKYLCDYFKKDDLSTREIDFVRFAKSGFPIVFSSKSAQSDYFKFYPCYKENTTTFILPFAVTLPDYSKVKIDELRKKFAIGDRRYFFCANQFWKHKNHLRLFEAVREIRDLGCDVQLVCSGSLSDYRNPEYFNQIEGFLIKHNLKNQIHILGFIDRCEQLCLIEHSLAVIQPSLFEGWSTVIEDAKALNKYVIASDLDVHREQLTMNFSLFDPYNVLSLVNSMLQFINSSIQIKRLDYEKSIKEFGISFKKIIDFMYGY